MTRSNEKPSAREVTFAATGDARDPYAAAVGGQRWTVRVNEFPEEPSLYTLFVDGVAAEELLEWPAAWSRPEDAIDRHEAERELAHFERTRTIAASKLVK